MNPHIIRITQRGLIGDFRVDTEGVMLIPGVELHELEKGKSQSESTKIDEGYLFISIKRLTFAGNLNTMSMPLGDIVRMQPYETAIDIYRKGEKGISKFIWGDGIKMAMIGFPGEDGKLKPLSGSIVGQFIINEKNKISNLMRPK